MDRLHSWAQNMYVLTQIYVTMYICMYVCMYAYICVQDLKFMYAYIYFLYAMYVYMGQKISVQRCNHSFILS